MVSLFFSLISIGFFILVVYFGAVFIIKTITGVSSSEAQTKLKQLFIHNQLPEITYNNYIFQEYDLLLKDILSNNAYEALKKRCELCVTVPANGIYVKDFLPYYFFSIVSSSDEDEIILKKSVEKLVLRYLFYYNYPRKVYSVIDEHGESGCKMIVVFFARNQEEYKRLLQFIRDKNVKEDTLRPSGEA